MSFPRHLGAGGKKPRETKELFATAEEDNVCLDLTQFPTVESATREKLQPFQEGEIIFKKAVF